MKVAGHLEARLEPDFQAPTTDTLTYDTYIDAVPVNLFAGHTVQTVHEQSNLWSVSVSKRVHAKGS